MTAGKSREAAVVVSFHWPGELCQLSVVGYAYVGLEGRRADRTSWHRSHKIKALY